MCVLVFATVPSGLYYTDMPLYSTFRLIKGAIRHVRSKAILTLTVIHYKNLTTSKILKLLTVQVLHWCKGIKHPLYWIMPHRTSFLGFFDNTWSFYLKAYVTFAFLWSVFSVFGPFSGYDYLIFVKKFGFLDSYNSASGSASVTTYHS